MESSEALSMGSPATSGLYETTVTKVQGRPSMPAEAESKPHYIVKRGSVSGFRNPYPSFTSAPGAWTMLRHVFWPIFIGRVKKPDTTSPSLPVIEPQWLPSRTSSDKLRATWLGHACYYVEFPSGLRVLFDPVFEARCSPLSFAGPKRFTQQPCGVHEIPIIDAVVISHSHYDHLSRQSVLEIQRRHPDVHFFVGLGLEKWFRGCGLHNVTELDWWEDAELTVTARRTDSDSEGRASTTTATSSAPEPDSGEKRRRGGSKKQHTMSARVSCLPCQHTSGRGLLDRDKTLWCSWAIRSDDRSVWFGGDTGYRSVLARPMPSNSGDGGSGGSDNNNSSDGNDNDAESQLPRCPQFEQIGALRGPFDLGLIPIGAYHPRVAFSDVHAGPDDAVDIMRDTRCRRALAMHWGTWALTLEDVEEPPRLLREALCRRGIPETGVFDVCDIGASREF